MDDVNPFAAPASDLAPRAKPPVISSSAQAWSDGYQLIVAKDAKLPDRCVKCNQPATTRLTRTYYWHNPAIYLSILAGVLIYVILAMVLRKSVMLNFGLCDDCRGKRQTDIWLGLAVLLAGMGVFALPFLMNPKGNEIVFLGLPIGLVVFLIGALMINSAVAVLAPKEIDDRIGRMKKAGDAFLRSLPEWRG